MILFRCVTASMTPPFLRLYAASKTATEGYSESLDHEVRTLGIRAILVEPTFTRTKIDKNASIAASAIGDYSGARERVVASIISNTGRGGDPARVAAAVAPAPADRKPKL